MASAKHAARTIGLRPWLGATLTAAVMVTMVGAAGMSPASAQSSLAPVELGTRADPDPDPADLDLDPDSDSVRASSIDSRPGSRSSSDRLPSEGMGGSVTAP
ncbi:MAG: hypothetical protein QOI36_4892 [Pseudonocardiales bacterium]|nr:hypothetical protein [Pseudonocardiales bacterium]